MNMAMIYKTTLGTLYTYLFKTRKLRPCIICHDILVEKGNSCKNKRRVLDIELRAIKGTGKHSISIVMRNRPSLKRERENRKNRRTGVGNGDIGILNTAIHFKTII